MKAFVHCYPTIDNASERHLKHSNRPRFASAVAFLLNDVVRLAGSAACMVSPTIELARGHLVRLKLTIYTRIWPWAR